MKKGGSSKNILIVEDDRFLAKAYEARFQKAGFSVVMASDGNEALIALKKQKPDIMLLDLVMPNKNGFEVLETMHNDPALKKIPVMILSILGQDADVKKGMELGAWKYMVKSEHSLQEIVDAVMTKLG